MEDIMNVAVIQMDVRKGDVAANRASVAAKVELAMQRNPRPEVIVLPELWASGYALERAVELASPLGEADAAFLGELAVRHNVAFAGGSVLSAEGDRVYNRAQVIDNRGRYLAGYNKVHLFRLMDEDKYLGQGNASLQFELCGMRCASVICYDTRFCEFIRVQALRGAQTLFVSAQWPLARKDHWVTLLRARAIENQMYVVACNRCGVTDGVTFGGHSLIIRPDGTLLASADESEDILVGALDPAGVSETREKIQVFRDRVPGLYVME